MQTESRNPENKIPAAPARLSFSGVVLEVLHGSLVLFRLLA
jgi:hypothetical protein